LAAANASALLVLPAASNASSRTISFLVRMVIALGHCHRLVAGEVVYLLYGDAEIEHSCDKGMAEIVGADVAKPSSLRWRQQLEAAYQQTAGSYRRAV